MTHPVPTRRLSPYSIALAAIPAALSFLPLLGHKPLTDWDEGIYAEISREMLTSGWLVPHWNQLLWFEKPPLMLWITSTLYRAFGISEFTARLGSALSGIVLVTVLHSWLELTRGRATAWLSTAMLLGCFGFLHICRVGEMDTLLALGCVLSLIGLDQANDNPRGWLLFWLGAVVALMTKGAASVTLFTTAAVYVAVEPTSRSGRRSSSIASRQFWLGAVLFLALTAPWHIAMYLRFGHPFMAEYLGFHVLSRATHQIEGHSTHWWYYLKVLLVSAPPFALLYPSAAYRSIRTGVLRVFAVFALVELVFFSIVQTRLPHYIAPAYPAFTAVTADLLANYVRQHFAYPRSLWIKLGAATGGVCAVAVLITAHPRSSLHSAVLANGTTLPDNKDAVAVLRKAYPKIRSFPGPLLILRSGTVPVNVDVFYSRRPAQQVQLASQPASIERDRYTNNPVVLASVLSPAPSLILLEKQFEQRLPPTVRFLPLEQGREVDLGLIQEVPGRP